MKKPKPTKPKGERVWVAVWRGVIPNSVRWYKGDVQRWLDEQPMDWRPAGITIRRATLTLDPPRRPK